jgi:hypothetical protein
MSIENQIERMMIEVLNIKNIVTALAKGEDLTTKVYDTADMLRILKVSRRSLANYRANGSLAFSKCNGRIFFTQENLEAFLKRNKFIAFSK